MRGLVVAVWLVGACAGQQHAERSSAPGERHPTLLITNETGVHVSIYVLPSNIKTGIAIAGTNCIELDEVTESTRRLRFEITAESTPLTTAREMILGTNWRIELGPWPQRWRWDVERFRPASRC